MQPMNTQTLLSFSPANGPKHSSKYSPERKPQRSFQRLAALALVSVLAGCSGLHTGAGIHVNVPILPGVSFGVNVGTGGVSAGVNAQSGPVGVGVGVNSSGQVTGRAGVGANTPGPVSVGGGVGVGGVIYDPKK
jgi:hypothetical protein